MIKAYKDRGVTSGEIVEVYRNLHNDLFSIRCSKTRLVLAHGECFVLRDGIPKVSKRGRERVLREKVKTVHAYIEGVYSGCLFCNKEDYVIKDEIYYNPYACEVFINKRTGESVGMEDILFWNKKAYMIEEKSVVT